MIGPRQRRKRNKQEIRLTNLPYLKVEPEFMPSAWRIRAYCLVYQRRWERQGPGFVEARVVEKAPQHRFETTYRLNTGSRERG